LFLQVLRW